MYYEDCGETREAVKRVREVDGENVTTWSREVTGFCIMEAEAGTNGYKDGDWGHGSRLFLRLKDLGGTAFCSSCSGNKPNGWQNEVVIALGGDNELSAMKEVLRWWLSILEAQSETEEE